MTRMRRTVRAGVVATGSAVVLAWSLAACGSSSAESASSPAAARDPGAALIDVMIARESIVSRGSGLTVEDLFAKPDGVDSFRAEVVEVTAGKAFNDVSVDEDSHAEEVSFDDDAADWRTFHVRVRVLEVFGGDVKPNSEVTLGLGFGDDLSVDIDSGGLFSMEEIVVFTAPETDVFSYDPAVQAVLNDGAFLSPVDDGGAVPFPVLTDNGYPPKLIDAIDSLADLRAASRDRPSSA